jgi:hypothetical protein
MFLYVAVVLVGVAISYGLDGSGIEYRQQARGFLFYKTVQTGSVAHPVSCLRGVWFRSWD